MADIELVIKMPQKLYKELTTVTVTHAGEVFAQKLIRYIKNGTPLPKGHGKIGDLDAVMSDILTSIDEMTNLGIAVDGDYLWAKLNDAIYNAPTIIEADKESEGENDHKGA